MSTSCLTLCLHSNNSDAAALSLQFLKGVRILCQLCSSSFNPTPSTPLTAVPDSVRVRSSTSTVGGTQRQRSSSLSPPLQTKRSTFPFPASPPTAAVDVLEVLEPIWDALGSWFEMLAEEVKRTVEEEAANSECTPLHSCATEMAVN